MPLPTTYSTGTASVSNGATLVTFAGAVLGSADAPTVQPGDLFLDPAQPLVPGQRIASVDYASGTAELWVDWPGTSMAAAPYEIRFVGDPVRSTAQTRRLLEQLSVVEANGRGLFYTFDGATADADPGPGNLRFNNATVGSATAAYLDNLDANGATVSAVLDTWDDPGASDNRGQVWVRSVEVPSAFWAFKLTGSVVDGTGYRKLTLVAIGGSGAFGATDALMVMFVPAGAPGPSGSPGAGGSPGAMGPPGPADSNRIINCNFDIWQRGASFSNPATNTCNADRWKVVFDGSGATRTISRQAFTIGQTAVPNNPKYFARFAQTVAGSGATYNRFVQRIEGVNTLAGRQVTVTFYALAASAVSITAALSQNFGTTGSPSAAVDTSLGSFAVGTTWTKCQAVVNVPSVSGKTLGTDNNDFLELRLSLPVNATFQIDLAHVSVVDGDVSSQADPLPPRALAFEAILARRYFQKSYNADVAPGTLTRSGSVAWWAGGTASFHQFYVRLPVTMRAGGTGIAYSTDTGSSGKIWNTTAGADVAANCDANQDNVIPLVNNVSVSNSFLNAHFTVEAEL